MFEVFLAKAKTVLSLRPKFKIVSIIPGIETLAPDLTDTNKGFFKSPNFFLESFSILANSNFIFLIKFKGNFFLLL